MIATQCAQIDSVGLLEFAQISQQSTERHQVFQSLGLCRHLAPGFQHRLQVRAAGLIDAQHEAIDIGLRRPVGYCLSEIASRLLETMSHRCDLRADEGRSHFIRTHAIELIHQPV